MYATAHTIMHMHAKLQPASSYSAAVNTYTHKSDRFLLSLFGFTHTHTPKQLIPLANSYKFLQNTNACRHKCAPQTHTHTQTEKIGHSGGNLFMNTEHRESFFFSIALFHLHGRYVNSCNSSKIGKISESQTKQVTRFLSLFINFFLHVQLTISGY